MCLLFPSEMEDDERDDVMQLWLEDGSSHYILEGWRGVCLGLRQLCFWLQFRLCVCVWLCERMTF